jgi:hypothetical protein
VPSCKSSRLMLFKVWTFSISICPSFYNGYLEIVWLLSICIFLLWELALGESIPGEIKPTLSFFCLKYPSLCISYFDFGHTCSKVGKNDVFLHIEGSTLCVRAVKASESKVKSHCLPLLIEGFERGLLYSIDVGLDL